MKVKAGIQERYANSRTPAFSLSNLLNYLLYSNLHVGLITAGVSTIPALISQSTIDFKSQIFILCSTVFIYNFDHSHISKADEINAPERCRWIQQNRKNLLLTNFSCMACCIWLLLEKGETFSYISALILLATCVFYSTSRILKKTPGMKSMVISMVWGFTCILLPMIWDQIVLEQGVVIRLMSCCCIIAFINSLFFDRKDLKGDLELGFCSLPALLGPTKTSVAIKGLSCTLLVLTLFDASLLGFSLIAACYALIESSQERLQKNTLLIDGLLLLSLVGYLRF